MPCIPVVYGRGSKGERDNQSIITLICKDHTASERAVLATFLRLQSGWPGGLAWKEDRTVIEF